MRTASWKLALVFGFTAATVWLAFEAGAAKTIAETLRHLGLLEFGALLVLFAALRACQAISLTLVTQPLGIRLRFHTSLDLAGLKGLYNLGLSGAGLVAQAVHGRSKALFSVGQLAWATGLQSLLLISALGAVVIASALINPFNQTGLTYSICVLGTAVIAFSLAIIRIASSSKKLSTRMPRWLREPLDRLRQVGRKPSLKQLGALLAIQLSIVLLRLARLLTIAIFIDASADLSELALVTSVADLLTTVPLTPGGIGAREFLIGLGAEMFGQVDLFLAAAIIDRGFTLLANLMHGGIVLLSESVRRRGS